MSYYDDHFKEKKSFYGDFIKLKAASFWMLVEINNDLIDRRVRRYGARVGIPLDQLGDFKNTVLEICAARYYVYDSRKSDLMTWIIWQARSVFRSAIRPQLKAATSRSNHSHVFTWESVMSDYDDKESVSDSADEVLSIEEKSVGSLASEEQFKSSLMAELKCYAQEVKEQCEGNMYVVLESLIEHNFSAMDSVISRDTRLSKGTVKRWREIINGELEMRFMKAGFHD